MRQKSLNKKGRNEAKTKTLVKEKTEAKTEEKTVKEIKKR